MSDTKVICRRSELVAVADATRSKTGRTDEMTLGEIASAITASGGVDLPDLTSPASASDILNGKEAIDENGNAITGSMPNNGAIQSTMDGINTKSITVPSGYTSGGTVSLDNTIDNEVDEQSDLIEQIMTVVDNLPEAGSGGEGTNIRTCTVLIQSTNILIRCYSSTNYTNDAGIHVEHNHDLSGYSYTINDVVCGSILTLHTTNPLIPGGSATGGAIRLDFAYGGAWMFSIPQEPTGDIVITVRDDD
jgi:hypothetical protein